MTICQQTGFLISLSKICIHPSKNHSWHEREIFCWSMTGTTVVLLSEFWNWHAKGRCTQVTSVLFPLSFQAADISRLQWCQVTRGAEREAAHDLPTGTTKTVALTLPLTRRWRREIPAHRGKLTKDRGITCQSKTSWSKWQT